MAKLSPKTATLLYLFSTPFVLIRRPNFFKWNIFVENLSIWDVKQVAIPCWVHQFPFKH